MIQTVELNRYELIQSLIQTRIEAAVSANDEELANVIEGMWHRFNAMHVHYTAERCLGDLRELYDTKTLPREIRKEIIAIIDFADRLMHNLFEVRPDRKRHARPRPVNA